MRPLLATLLLFLTAPAFAQEGDLYRYVAGQETAWASPENPTAARGKGGIENHGAKGHAFDRIAAGGTLTLADIQGAGMIDRIWITIDDRSPERLRSLVLEIYWDGARTPAVSVPLGDFFLQGAGEMKPLDTALFASPEGRSFVSYAPMPFRTSARLLIRNESATPLPLVYFDVDFRRLAAPAPDALYFHAYWHRERATVPGHAFRILPALSGRGRYIGTSVTVQTDPRYGKSWWGEGEMRISFDGEAQPSLVGTGTEDYIGTAWGQGAYVNRYQGSPVADQASGRWALYRFHIPDPVYFARGIAVDYQQIGGAEKADVLRLQRDGAPLIPVTVVSDTDGTFRRLLESDKPVPLGDSRLPDGWTNFYRSDDVAAVAYFYIDRPEAVTPPLAGATERTAGLRKPG
jgi:hypothetical protein